MCNLGSSVIFLCCTTAHSGAQQDQRAVGSCDDHHMIASSVRLSTQYHLGHGVLLGIHHGVEDGGEWSSNVVVKDGQGCCSASGQPSVIDCHLRGSLQSW